MSPANVTCGETMCYLPDLCWIGRCRMQEFVIEPSRFAEHENAEIPVPACVSREDG